MGLGHGVGTLGRPIRSPQRCDTKRGGGEVLHSLVARPTTSSQTKSASRSPSLNTRQAKPHTQETKPSHLVQTSKRYRGRRIGRSTIAQLHRTNIGILLCGRKRIGEKFGGASLSESRGGTDRVIRVRLLSRPLSRKGERSFVSSISRVRKEIAEEQIPTLVVRASKLTSKW